MPGLPKNYHLYKSFLISETMCVYILFILEHNVFLSHQNDRKQEKGDLKSLPQNMIFMSTYREAIYIYIYETKIKLSMHFNGLYITAV